jgi:hypothetical protein
MAVSPPASRARPAPPASTRGKDSIDHPPQGHDDIANAVAGACLAATEHGTSIPLRHLPTHAIGRSYDVLASAEENARALAREEAQSGWPVRQGDERLQQAYGLGR